MLLYEARNRLDAAWQMPVPSTCLRVPTYGVLPRSPFCLKLTTIAFSPGHHLCRHAESGQRQTSCAHPSMCVWCVYLRVYERVCVCVRA